MTFLFNGWAIWIIWPIAHNAVGVVNIDRLAPFYAPLHLQRSRRRRPVGKSQDCPNVTSGVPVPDSKVHGAHMGPIWGRHDPGGPHVGPMNLAIWGYFYLGFLKHVTVRYSPRLRTYGIYARPFVQPRNIATFQLVLNMLNLPNYTCINSHRLLAGQIYMIKYSWKLTLQEFIFGAILALCLL